MFVQNLTQVTELFLDGVKITAEGKEWCQALSPLRKLRVLSMSYCNLTGSIDSSISMLVALENIRLNLNNISGLVPESFSDLSNLKVLELRDCRLSGHFPNGIFQIQALNVLDVSNNHDLHGYLPNFLQNLSLHTLKLSNTNFSGQIPTAISNLKHLSTLNLSDCQFNGTFPISMSKLTQIVELDLSFNGFIGPIPSLNISKNLRYFSILHNNLSGSIQSSHFEGLLHLININLGDNSLYGKVPSSLFTLPSLHELTLSSNGFHSPLDEFPNASSSQLHLVDLSHNKLEGHVPLSFFRLKGLRFLQLSENEFNGTIHLVAIHNLPSLHTLGLSNNNLYSTFPIMKYLLLASCKLEEFPSFLRNQSQLHALDLSNNQIHGTIPNWIWRFESLVYLNLSNNFLTSLEGPLENLNSNLYILDLHSNHLHGSVPTFTKYAVHVDYSSNRFSYVPSNMNKHIPFLYFFSLSNNSLQGEIDDLFCNFSSLRLLDLSYNSFSGSIPKCLTRKNSTLRVLNLAKNKLTDHIFAYYVTANELGGRYFDSVTIVNKGSYWNLIKIPSVFTSLDFSSNRLEGPIPEELVNLRALHVLNMSHNAFFGHIPGKIPTGTQMQTFDAYSFEGNDGLCGFPLTKNCGDNNGIQEPMSPSSGRQTSINWSLLSVEC
ncbi:hypothetical protein PIB30_095763 [Stylosanthes scabra]|uniref:Disease resistance R13L4/SHOC-2-like LRR domain-containing protein n=1 Tax=Stylosanthes scabra TaxID=79078 RepID=A0ABU6WWS5_9FABA|nr:hypothetical protein [Stylosanthes scabra]